jgi:predicted alpha/beta-fold hydrolase
MATPEIISSVIADSVLQYRLQSYVPTWWLASGHLQTAFSAIGWHRGPSSAVNYNRELLPVIAAPPGKYGGTLALDWTLPPANEPYHDDTPIMVVLHGLTGGSDEGYVLRMIHEMLEYRDTHVTVSISGASSTRRMRAVVINARGCGGSTLSSPQTFCGAMTGDVHQAVTHIHNRYPRAPLVGVGFSLGANILTKYIGEESGRCLLTAACVLANPWDLLFGERTLSASCCCGPIYLKQLSTDLVQLFHKHRPAFANETDINFDDIESVCNRVSTHPSIKHICLCDILLII